MRLHFRLRTLMIVVTVGGLGLGAYVGIMRKSQLAESYRRRAAEHAMWKSIHRESEERFHALWQIAVRDRDPESEDYRSTSEWDRKRAEYHDAMMRKYEEAAVNPWFPVEPDPPPPESGHPTKKAPQ